MIWTVFVKFITSSFQVSWQQWMLELDSELDFEGFVTVEFGENEHFAAALGSGNDLA